MKYKSSNSNKDINKKESVELFVYLAIGIWRGLNTNKQYPTLVSYGADTECANVTYGIQAMSVIAYLVFKKSPNFIAKDSETLSLKYVIGYPIPQN